MNLKDMRNLHNTLVAKGDQDYINSWVTWNINSEDTVTIFMTIDGNALIQIEKVNWDTGKRNNTFTTRKVKEGKILVDGERYLTKYPH